jgi:hypothetical protein
MKKAQVSGNSNVILRKPGIVVHTCNPSKKIEFKTGLSDNGRFSLKETKKYHHQKRYTEKEVDE